ncbi:molybdopterin-dependent oxidoreductase [Mangrovicoccus algicola]|uniref:molybdopterin-dependent oxidoreductase n=1 Tax=Mangrovicoccus algicola TaxID=2771008 RepID=UPI001D02687C|nr:molybdopterin-dependent oxidoreductase [Mangrovicoccus algicola]
MLAVCAAMLLGATARAADLPAPTGTPILTISGRIETTNDGDRAVFDMDMLRSLPSVTFETTTSWTKGVQSFTGVSLKVLLETVGAQGDSISATAINDYAVDIPREDWVEGGPILAYLNNGETMSVREHGPLWVVYPYDLNPAYQSEVTFSRSIWQLDRIIVTR